MIEAVVFDLDGVLVDSEHVWDEAREQLAGERGGRWHEQASRDMMGMSSPDSRRHVYPLALVLAGPVEQRDELAQRFDHQRCPGLLKRRPIDRRPGKDPDRR